MENNEEIKVGDKVIYIANCSKYTDGNNDIVKDDIGICRQIRRGGGFDKDDMLVEFEKTSFVGHNGNGTLNNKRGWYCDIEGFKKIN